MPLVLGVDSSIPSTTVELRDADDGRLYASGRAVHSTRRDETGGSDEEPKTWWHGLVEARHDAGSALGVAAVAIAAHAERVVVLDRQGRMLTVPGAARAREVGRAADDLLAMLDPPGWVRSCGWLPGIRSPIVWLAWLRRADPSVFADIEHVLMPHDWLTHRLSRQLVTDRGDASMTGYWSPRQGRWSTEVLAYLDDGADWADRLPAVLEPAEPAGDRDGVSIAPGTGVPMAMALGVALAPGDLVLSLRSPTALFTVRDAPTEDPSGEVSGLADATGRFLAFVAVPDVMGSLSTMAGMLGVDLAGFDQLARGAPPGAGGVVVIPPTPASSGVVAGVTSETVPAQVARATYEGVACDLLEAREALRTADVPVGGKIVFVGSGARSHMLQRVVADVLGRPVAVPQGDTVANGACVQAAAVLHGASPGKVAEAWRLGPARGIDPDDRVDVEAIRARFRAIRDRTSSPERTA